MSIKSVTDSGTLAPFTSFGTTQDVGKGNDEGLLAKFNAPNMDGGRPLQGRVEVADELVNNVLGEDALEILKDLNRKDIRDMAARSC